MSNRVIYVGIVCLFVLSNGSTEADASFLDWIWPNRNVPLFGTDLQTGNIPAVPFELSETNDKFIRDTSKILGTKLSNLDFCQQRVVLAIKKSCNSLTDEELGKLAVELLNCQLATESRDTYECSEDMQLKDCISNMPSQVRHSYDLIVSRAKAVCLAIRQEQFRGMAEMTVNKLMSSAHQHLQLMADLKGTQELLERSTLQSLDEITDNHLKLLEKQKEILNLADVQRISTETNVREIVKERSLIRSSQNELNSFIANLKEKIDEGVSGLESQSAQSKQVYDELLKDLSELSAISEKISNRLEDMSEMINAKKEQTSAEFDRTVDRLNEANAIIENFSRILNDVKDDFNRKLLFVEEYLGKDYAIERLRVITIHVVVLLIGMICLVFVNADPVNRALFLGTLVINLLAVLNEVIVFDLTLLIETILVLLAANVSVKLAKKYKLLERLPSLSISVAETKKKSEPSVTRDQNGNAVRENGGEQIRSTSSYLHSGNRSIRTPSLQPVDEGGDRISVSSRRSISRMSTPSVEDNAVGRCKAMTMRGVRCSLVPTLANPDFCYIHERTSRDR